MFSNKLVAVIALVLLLGSGCATQVATRVNAFRAPGPLVKNVDIAVIAENPEQGKSLEFQHYKSQVEQALAQQGYRVVSGPNSQYQALLAYSVKRLESRKDGGLRTGIVTSAGVGRHGFGSNLLLIDEGPSKPLFERAVNLVISENTKVGAHLYEVSGVSEGACGVLSEVFDDMLKAIFTEFPAANGRLRIVKVPASSGCR